MSDTEEHDEEKSLAAAPLDHVQYVSIDPVSDPLTHNSPQPAQTLRHRES